MCRQSLIKQYCHKSITLSQIPSVQYSCCVSVFLTISSSLILHQRIAGDESIGFNNSVFLSERASADRNFSMGYYMKVMMISMVTMTTMTMMIMKSASRLLNTICMKVVMNDITLMIKYCSDELLFMIMIMIIIMIIFRRIGVSLQM